MIGGPLVPAELDRAFEIGKREGDRFGFYGFAFRCGEAAPGVDGDFRGGTTPGSGDLSVDEKRTGPDTCGPELGAMAGVGNEELAVGVPEEIEGVATGQETRRRCGDGVGMEGRFIFGEDMRFADGRADGDEPGGEATKGCFGFCGENAGPFGERCGGRGAEDVEIAAGEFEAGLLRIERGRRDGPDCGLAGAVPAHENSAGGRGVAEAVVRDAHGAACVSEGHALAAEDGVEAFGGGPRAGEAAGIARQAA